MGDLIGTAFDIWPWLAALGGGLWTLMKGIFPPTPKEDPEFYRYETSVYGPGFDKVIDSGMMNPFNARLIAIIAGSVLILIGALGILHHFQLPPFAPETTSF